MQGEAGYKDAEKNKKLSDIYIAVDLSKNESLTIDVKAQFQKLFGRHIEEAIRAKLTEMGVDKGYVYAEDYGALDFIIRGRVKSAVDKARRML